MSEQNPVFLHATGEGRIQRLLRLGLGIGIHLPFMPFLGRQHFVLVILEAGIVLGAQEENDGVAMLLLPLCDGHHAVHARVEFLAGEEAEHVANIHDGMSRPRLHVMPTFRQQDLEAPLFTKEKRQAARIGMFVQAAPFCVGVLLGILQQAQECFGWLTFSMEFFKSSSWLQG